MSAQNCRVGKITNKAGEEEITITYNKNYGLTVFGKISENINTKFIVTCYRQHPAVQEFLKDNPTYLVLR